MPEIRYPFKNFRYKVEFNGTEAAGFSEVSGADISVDVIEYREGNEVRTTPRKLAGLTKYGNITLKWGVVGSMEMMEWLHGCFRQHVRTYRNRAQDHHDKAPGRYRSRGPQLGDNQRMAHALHSSRPQRFRRRGGDRNS
jgi:hypothetical protein